jgi:hypothetical protein
MRDPETVLVVLKAKKKCREKFHMSNVLFVYFCAVTALNDHMSFILKSLKC